MRPRITLITIGVDNLERSLRFYRDGLGLKAEGIILKLALWPGKSIARDTNIPYCRSTL